MYYKKFSTLYNQIINCTKEVPGYQTQQICKDLITEEINKAYDSMKKYK